MLLALKMEESSNNPKDVGSCRKLEKAKTNQNKKNNKKTKKPVSLLETPKDAGLGPIFKLFSTKALKIINSCGF